MAMLRHAWPKLVPRPRLSLELELRAQFTVVNSFLFYFYATLPPVRVLVFPVPAASTMIEVVLNDRLGKKASSLSSQLPCVCA